MIYLLPEGVVLQTQDLTDRVAEHFKLFGIPDITYGWEPCYFTEKSGGGFTATSARQIGDPHYALTISDSFHIGSVLPYQYHRLYQVARGTGYVLELREAVEKTYNKSNLSLMEMRRDAFEAAFRYAVQAAISDLFDTLDEKPVSL